MTKQKKVIVITSIVILLLMTEGVFKTAFAKAEVFIKDGEGLYLNAYKDTGGVWTIGWGSIYNYDAKRPVQAGDKINLATAQRWLEIEMKQKADAVKEGLKVPQNSNQIAALVSFAYNVGIGAYNRSTLLRYINQRKSRSDIERAFMMWVKDNGQVIPGLINRRKNEIQLYFS